MLIWIRCGWKGGLGVDGGGWRRMTRIEAISYRLQTQVLTHMIDRRVSFSTLTKIDSQYKSDDQIMIPAFP